MSFDDSVLFKIGIQTDPRTPAQLAALATSVRETLDSIEGASRRAEQSLSRIGDAAVSASGRVSNGRINYGPSVDFGAAPITEMAARPRTSSYEMQLGRLGSLAGVLPENVAGLGPSPAAVQKKGKDDARRYATSFTETIGQLSGLTPDDMSLLTGGKERRWKQLGAEDARAYGQSLREQLTSDLGLSGPHAEELFGARGGAGLQKQQAEHAAETARLNQSL
ncbi:MAG: hypothetical protein ACTHK7_17060, partial [Aureliella sp.]